MTNNGQFTVLRYKCFQYTFHIATEIMMVKTSWKKWKIGSKWNTFTQTEKGN